MASGTISHVQSFSPLNIKPTLLSRIEAAALIATERNDQELADTLTEVHQEIETALSYDQNNKKSFNSLYAVMDEMEAENNRAVHDKAAAEATSRELRRQLNAQAQILQEKNAHIARLQQRLTNGK